MRKLSKSCGFAALIITLVTRFADPAAAAVSDDPVTYAGQFPVATATLTATTLVVGDLARDVLVYRPSAAAAATPVLIFFTGTGGTPDYSTADEIGREWLQAFADREGVILVFPLPRPQTYGDWDNHSSGTPYWQTADADGTDAAVSADPDRNPDLLFARALIKESIERYGADPGRIYFSGFSNGAMFSYFAATTLADRVAAFAETGGGLILSNTTAGEPTPCRPAANPGSTGAMRSCTDTGWTTGMCVSPDATPRPRAVPISGRVPPAFLRAQDDDDVVPYTHTCNLAAALATRTDVEASVEHQGGGHIVSLGFLESSWAFLKTYRLPPQSGWWWNPAESGRGFSLEVNGNSLFIASFLYAPSGRALWYAASGRLRSDGGFSGQLLEFRGGQTLIGSYQPAEVAGSPGNIDLTCTSTTSCSLSWPGGNVPIQRFTWATGARAATAAETGWWWNAAESGRGYFLEVQGNTLSATSYMYDAVGDALWYLTSGTVTGTTFQSQWNRFANGQSLTGAYVEPIIIDDRVGTVTIEFTDTTNATLTLPDGRQIPITRFGF